MKSKQTAFLLVFLFVLMASASAQPMDVEMTEELEAPKVSTVFLSDFKPNGRTIISVATTTVEIVPFIDGVVDDEKTEIKVLDKYELQKDDYFTRKPIILLQNSRSRTDD
jgi:uncharacterized hydantoinase/oxoprolinase family protein